MPHQLALSPSVGRFHTIQQQTRCPFARDARVWGASNWDSTVDWDENCRRIALQFWEFTNAVREEELDGFVVEFDGLEYGQAIPSLAGCLNRFLRSLSHEDPLHSDCMRKVIDMPEWEFSFAGERVFIIVFAPCYAKSSSRYGFGCENVFVLLQPQSSFEHHKIPRGYELGLLRARIRSAFHSVGADYDTGTLAAIMNGPLEAVRFIKPLTPDDPPVQWWKAT